MSDHKELLKHSRNYLFANIATKALSFISIPIFTRLLSVEEYGVVNVYISVIMIAPILLTLNTEVAISRYYFDSKSIDDFKDFVGCSIIISTAAFALMSLVSVLMLPWISTQLSFPPLLTLTIIPVSFYKITNSIFTQIYNPIMESKKIAIVSSIQAYLAFGLSVFAILLLPSEKYYGYVIGNVLAMIMLGIYLYHQVIPYCNFSFKKKHIRYLINYCLPYLPYSLSGIIIAQFGKLIISDASGFESVGLYSFASNITLVMLVFIGLIHQAWNPFYFRYMNTKDYKSVDQDYGLIWRGTLVLGCVLSLFSYELSALFGKPEYIPSIRIIPVLAVGYVFYQWSYVYMRNAGYAKQTVWMGIAVVVSGLVNIGLSVVMVPIMADMGVAVAFTTSYAVMLLLTYVMNRYILKIYSPKVRQFIPPLLLSMPVFMFSVWINTKFMTFEILLTSLKCVIIILIVFILSKPYKSKLLYFLTSKKNLFHLS